MCQIVATNSQNKRKRVWDELVSKIIALKWDTLCREPCCSRIAKYAIHEQRLKKNRRDGKSQGKRASKSYTLKKIHGASARYKNIAYNRLKYRKHPYYWYYCARHLATDEDNPETGIRRDRSPLKKLQTHLGDVFKLLKDAGERLRPMQKQRDSSSHNHSSLLPAISCLKFLLNISLKQVPRRGPGLALGRMEMPWADFVLRN